MTARSHPQRPHRGDCGERAPVHSRCLDGKASQVTRPPRETSRWQLSRSGKNPMRNECRCRSRNGSLLCRRKIRRAEEKSFEGARKIFTWAQASSRLHLRIHLSGKNPLVLGLVFAVVRDLVSFLRYEIKDAAGRFNPLGQIRKPPPFVMPWAGAAPRAAGFSEIWFIMDLTKTSRTERFLMPWHRMSRPEAD